MNHQTPEDLNHQIVNETAIYDALKTKRTDTESVRETLAKALELRGLDETDIPVLAHISSPDLLDELFSAARKVKEEIYGRRLVIFAPLYISNLCANECLYCGFRARNKAVHRRALNQDEIATETRILIDQGHKRILLVAGESYPREGLDYVLESINTVYQTKSGTGEIRRININIAPLEQDEFRRVKECNIGTYQLFQETYHRETYEKVHVAGKKKDYFWRIGAMDRALRAGIEDVGIGVLFGLFDWRFEILALMQHIRHLEKNFGIGPHTISMPRLEPALGSRIAEQPPHPVSDLDFRKIVAILRLAVPYTGIIMSTRETPEMRRETFAVGVSQISAGSRTNPGGYGVDEEDCSQFSLGDHRPLDEVIRDVAHLGYIPSFCTGCYRLGRTGKDFMDLAKPGEIRYHCDPNAASTFMEYLVDYASEPTRKAGELVMAEFIDGMSDRAARRTRKMVERIVGGERDVYC